MGSVYLTRTSVFYHSTTVYGHVEKLPIISPCFNSVSNKYPGSVGNLKAFISRPQIMSVGVSPGFSKGFRHICRAYVFLVLYHTSFLWQRFIRGPLIFSYQAFKVISDPKKSPFSSPELLFFALRLGMYRGTTMWFSAVWAHLKVFYLFRFWSQ